MATDRRNFRDNRAPQIRVNHRIRVPEVRVVLEDGGVMLGVMTTQQALREAEERGLDLVEVNPKATPPVCKILDFGKFKYEEKKRARDAKRKQTVVEVKEIKLRPKTDDHDLDVKLRAARRFIESGNKVKFTVRFRGREIAHPDRARMQLDWLREKADDLASVEQPPTMEARAMSLILAPRPQVLQRLAAERQKERAQKREREDSNDDLDEENEPDLDEDDDDEDDDDEGGED
ncbi:MAG TPA: translation initiation factor IF-3 [Polyangiaceae bacterium]|nr:translation initiation factor IF-3 [Polyangiaceae bacterium]